MPATTRENLSFSKRISSIHLKARREIVFLALLLFAFKSSIAQWSANGSHIYNSNSGYVGIGTTSPTHNLTVNGTFGLQYGGAPKYHMAYYNGGFNIAESGVLDYRIFIKDGGNVGLGLNNPETKLHVNGGARFNGNGWFGRNNNGVAGVSLSIGQNQGWDYPAVEISTTDDGGVSSSSWFGTRWAHTVRFQRASSAGTKNIVDIIGNDGEQALQVYSIDGGTSKIKFSADGTSFIQGNVAIGTATDNGYKLAVNGDAGFNGNGWFGRNNNGVAGVSLRIGQNQGWDYPAVEISTADDGGVSSSSWFGTRWEHTVRFQRASSAGTKNIVDIIGNDGEQALQVYSTDGGTSRIKFSADGTSFIQGNVAIGTTTDHGYKLAVNGNILAQKLRITQNDWPDYVFHPSYKLPSLRDLEQYIRLNNHLPGVASAADIEKNGLDVGDNQAVLLKKIEELTLYIIQQDKKIELQNEKLACQEKQISELLQLKKEMEDIKSLVKKK